MKNIQPVHVPERDTLADLYIRHFDQTSHLFTYHPYHQASYFKRREDVLMAEGRLQRSKLKATLQAYNQRVNSHAAVQKNIDLLEQEDSVVVIGGQQAGVMTGPLYTIHKAITILQLARQQRAALQIPVIPVFWIAGEDHDLEEVNHIWVRTEDNRPERLRFGAQDGTKQSVGMRDLDAAEVETFLKRVADHHPDSPFKKVWLNKLHELAEQSYTFSDWFARTFHWLFADEGLVLFDSAAKEFKEVAAPFYVRMIEQCEGVHEAVSAGIKQVQQMGYESQVEMQSDQANLFIEENGERALLFTHDDTFVTKGSQSTYSRQTLIDIAQTHPERLSTNVVTRPLLQEYLFPTLAAVLGPGEIAYWGLYGQAFSLFGWQMPVLFPRLGFTLVERDVRATMDRFHLSPREALYDLETFREQWLSEQDDIGTHSLFAQLKNEMAELHQRKTRPVLSLNQGVADLVEKNRARILRELHYLEKQVDKTIRLKHEATLTRFDRVQADLTPHGRPQERVYNLFSYVNQYGWDWLDALLHEPLDLSQTHYMVDL